MGSCHSSNSIKSKKKLVKKSKSKTLIDESILIDDQFDSLTLKNNDLSAYIDLNSSIFQKHSPSMSSLTSTNSVLSTESQSSSTSLTKPGSNPVSHRSIPVLGRFVYNPRQSNTITSTSSIITTSSSKQSNLTKSLSTSPPSSPNSTILTTHIKIEQVLETKNATTKKSLNNRREFSPFRSFLKAPSAIVNNQSNMQTNFSSNSSLTKHNQSSSLSSLSSTSSSLSNSKTTDAKQKSNLIPPKKIVKSPIKTNVLPSPSKLKNSISNIPNANVSKSENVDKVEKNEKTVIQNKRLFSPYKYSSTLIKPSVLTENINLDNSDQVEVKKTETTSTFTSKENSTTQVGISKLKFSYNKIPAPNKTNIKTISQSKLTKFSDNNSKMNETMSNLLKRDDSAYNSSTSSTVSSSNDAEETKEDIKLDETKNFTENNKINKSSVNKSKTSIEESVGELNQLIVSSSSIGSSVSTNQEDKNQEIVSNTPIFKPPSNLPPVENGEVIILDLDTYRLLMQDLQSCKIIMHKLGAILKEPSILGQSCDSGQSSQNEDSHLSGIINPLLSSFYQHNNGIGASSIDKCDQSTQTD